MLKNFSHCFKQYDIRGVVGKELNNDFAYWLGRYLGGKNKVVIGKDSRKSSAYLLKNCIKGLMDSGSNVIELEDISTSPLLYYADRYFQPDIAIMITGSHNPLEFNGFKILKKGVPLLGEELKQLIDDKILREELGTHRVANIKLEYLDELLKHVNIKKTFKIAWDCNNNALAELIKKIPGEHVIINEECEGDFAHNPPDPMVKNNLEDLKKKIISEKCDFGFASDGDGDRVVFIDSKGKELSSNQLIYLLVSMLGEAFSVPILVDVKASKSLVEELKSKGVEVIYASGGHSIMKRKVIELNAIFAGEASGHYVINDGKYFPFDDAFYIALRIIEFLQKNKIPLFKDAQFRREYKLFNLQKEEYLKKFEQIKGCYQSLNGIRKEYKNGWWLLRFSNTEDYLLVLIEADNEQFLNLLIKELSEIVNISLSLS